jgi:hypothetical protein
LEEELVIETEDACLEGGLATRGYEMTQFSMALENENGLRTCLVSLGTKGVFGNDPGGLNAAEPGLLTPSSCGSSK